MSVGLYDADMATYIHTAPNLELMKYAAYYKQNGEIAFLSPQFKPSLFSKFIYRKDYDDGNFPSILKNPNLVCGGLSYSNNIYKPLPLEIEKSIPDTSIYNKMTMQFGDSKENFHAFKTCLNTQHLRLSLDGENIWEDFEKQIDLAKKKSYFFHDYDLNKIKDSHIIIKDLIKGVKDPAFGRISTKFPIQVYNEEDMEKWIYFPTSFKFFNLNYYGLMSTDYFKHFIKVFNKPIQYIVTYGFKDQQDFVDNGIEKMYDQYIIACTNRKKILLIYDDNFFTDKVWEDFFLLLKLFNSRLCNSPKKVFLETRHVNNLYRFVKNFKPEHKYEHNLNPDKVRRVFGHIRVANYNLFKKLYESCLTEVV